MERLRPYYALLILVYFVILSGRQIGTSELVYFGGDESRHFMNGVFYHDLLADGGWRDPLRYVRWYYPKYPALSVHQYPPLFYLLEALVITLAGVQPLAVQAVILSILGCCLAIWYRMLCRKFSPEVGLLTLLWLLSTSLFLRNFAHIMLDSTALALTLVVLTKLWHWETSGWRRDLALTLGCLMLVLGIAFKAYFLVFYLLLVFSYYAVRKRPIRTRITVVVMAFCAIFLIFFTFGTIAQTTRIPLLYQTLQGVNMISFKRLLRILTGDLRFLFKFEFLRTFGISGIVFVLLGLGWIVKNATWRSMRHELLYAANFLFVFGVCIIHFEPARFHLFLLPVMALLAGSACDRIRQMFRGIARHVAGGAIVLVLVGQGIVFTPAYVRGYEQAARDVVDLNTTAAPILCDAYADGNFIAYVRKFDPEKRQIVFRGDKLLFTFKIYYRDLKSINVHQEEDVYQMLDHYGIRYILVDGRFTEMKPKALLRRVLQNSVKFTRLKHYSIETNMPPYASGGLTLYEYRDVAPDETRELSLNIPVMSTGLSFSIQELRAPFQP